MTQTIEQLQARVRELEERICDLTACKWPDAYTVIPVKINGQLHATSQAINNEINSLRQQLAASQAYAEQLREALENHSGNYTLTKAECKVINDLLDQPTETSALDVYVAEKVKEAMK